MTTERLRLEPWDENSAELLVAWSADPQIMRYIGTGELWTREFAQERAAWVAAHWAEHGFGWRIGYARDRAAAVGLFALHLTEESSGVGAGQYEIGWWVDPTAWGHGYAREGGAAIRDEAFALGAPSVVARIRPANDASIRVAEALGLTYEGETAGRFGEPLSVYRAPRP